MKVIKFSDIKNTEREVKCPKGNFISNRFLLEKDGMGYTITKTIIPEGTEATWHYKNHLESCYCIKGEGILSCAEGSFHIVPDTLYVLDKHDLHGFEALTDVHLICVFNPPLKGNEVHKIDGSYEA